MLVDFITGATSGMVGGTAARQLIWFVLQGGSAVNTILLVGTFALLLAGCVAMLAAWYLYGRANAPR
jgi:riboflavin transporter FmnP